jgi:hypothetical protein
VTVPRRSFLHDLKSTSQRAVTVVVVREDRAPASVASGLKREAPRPDHIRLCKRRPRKEAPIRMEVRSRPGTAMAAPNHSGCVFDPFRVLRLGPMAKSRRCNVL